eukprot:jgi/Picsp_1/2961/NSC_01185-R1_erd4-related membrane protein
MSSDCEVDGNYETITCYNTNVTGENVVTSIILDVILGVLCYIGFVLWRGYFTVYRGREILPGVRNRPPKLSIKGWKRFYTWMIPAMKVDDAEFIASAGIDALVAVRVLSYGGLLFIPVGLAGIAILLPINYTGDYFVQTGAVGNDTSSSNLTYLFLRMTISNIENGSSVLWVHFVFLIVMVLYGCYLIILYYEENISMQHTMFSTYVESAKVSSEMDGTVPDEGGGCGDIEDPDSQEASVAEKEEGGGLENNYPGLSSIPTTEVNDRIVKMMDPENKSLLAQAFRQTVVGTEPGKLWPIRKPQPFTPDRPQFAGKYAVLVIDEPRKQFSKMNRVSLTLLSRGKKKKEKGKKQSFWENLKFFFKRGQKSAEPEELEMEEEEINIPLPRGISLARENLRERKPKSKFCGMMKESNEEVQKTFRDRHERFHFIAQTFQKLYGDDFNCIIPIYNTEDIDGKLMKLYGVQAQIERIKLSISDLQKLDTPKSAKKLALLEKKMETLQEKEVALQQLVKEAKETTLKDLPRPAFIALFHSAIAAYSASNINANPISWRGFHTVPCPDPENLNFPSLCKDWGSRSMRYPISLFFIILVMIFPIGIFTGAFSQLETAICGAPEDATASASGSWICSDNTWAQFILGLITGVLPQILMTVYQSVFLPIYVMFCSQAEGRHVSLSSLDLRCAQLFFHWTVWNFFLGTLLGGAVLNGLREAISDPGKIVDILGRSLSASSNFFINYVILRAFTMTMFRLFFPHACISMNIAQWFRVMPRPKTVMDFARANPMRNCRYSRDLSIAVLTIFVASLTYTIISPFILPFTMFYFVVMYIVWRYQQLYVYQSAYNSSGQMWRFYAHRLLACFALTILFTGIMLLIKRAYVQGGIAIICGELFILAFNKYIVGRYDSIYDEPPISLLESIPRANIDSQLFLPPPLREDEEGWFLEWGKAWQYWGAPRYGY